MIRIKYDFVSASDAIRIAVFPPHGAWHQAAQRRVCGVSGLQGWRAQTSTRVIVPGRKMRAWGECFRECFQRTFYPQFRRRAQSFQRSLPGVPLGPTSLVAKKPIGEHCETL